MNANFRSVFLPTCLLITLLSLDACSLSKHAKGKPFDTAIVTSVSPPAPNARVRGFFYHNEHLNTDEAKLSAWGSWSADPSSSDNIDIAGLEMFGLAGHRSASEVATLANRLAPEDERNQPRNPRRRVVPLREAYGSPFWSAEPRTKDLDDLPWLLDWVTVPWDGSSKEYTVVVRVHYHSSLNGVMSDRAVDELRRFNGIEALTGQLIVPGSLVPPDSNATQSNHDQGTSVVATGNFFGSQNTVVYDITVDFLPGNPEASIVRIAADHTSPAGPSQNLRVAPGPFVTPCRRALSGYYDGVSENYYLHVLVRYKKTATSLPEDDAFTFVFSGIKTAQPGAILQGR